MMRVNEIKYFYKLKVLRKWKQSSAKVKIKWHKPSIVLIFVMKYLKTKDLNNRILWNVYYNTNY